LTQEWQHRVSRITEQRDEVSAPCWEWVAIEQAPFEAMVGAFEQ
jgi:hypothetical protein